MTKKATPAPEAEAPPPALQEIISRAAVLSQYRARLGDLVNALNAGIEALKADRLADVRQATDEAGFAWKALAESIDAHPELFVKPRSLVAHGIKFGFQKAKGTLEIADEDRTVALIEKLMPEQAELLISVKKAPVKDALAQLPATDLKKLGVQLKDTGDVVFIKPADGAVDKLVKALIASAVEGE